MFPKKQSAAFYLIRSGLYLYVANSPQVISLSFPPDTVKDIEIINSEKLLTLLNTFFATNKLTPISATVVLGPDVVFEKDIVVQNPQNPNAQKLDGKALKEMQVSKQEQEEIAMKGFVDYVPFDEKLIQSFKVNNGKHVVVANKALIDGISKGLLKFQSDISGVVPYFIFGKADIFSGGLNSQLGHTIIQRSDLVRQNNMLESYQAQADENNQLEKKPVKQNNKRLFILVGAFGILLVIMVAFYFMSASQSVPPTTSSKPPLPTATQPIATESSQLNADVGSSSAQLSSIVIKITHSSPQAVRANSLRSQLNTAGFSSIQTEIVETNNSPRTTVLFSPGLSNDIKNRVLPLINSVAQDVLSQESNQQGIDVTIILGNN